MLLKQTIGGITYRFRDLKDLLAKATPLRSGDELAGIAAQSAVERVAAQRALAELPLRTFLNEFIIPYEIDEVTRLIADTHSEIAFQPIASLTVGGFRDWLLSEEASSVRLAEIAPGLTPEMAAAVSKIMRLQDLIAVARKIRVVTRFRTTVGLAGRLSTRLQPNHPTDDPTGIAASIIDGLLLGSGDAVIGINPASDNVAAVRTLLELIDYARERYSIPTQSCVLAHITTQMEALRLGAPVDLLFQSIAGTELANASFGVNLGLLEEAHQAASELKRGTIGDHVMYFETGQGSALSANAHHGVDQQTCEARSYAVARQFSPMLVNTVVGFIGPEYLYDGRQIIRAGLEDHFCGKLLGLPMGCDVCYTNHAEADQDDMDSLLTLLGAAGVNYIMGVPGADDVMLQYQSTSFHDALYLRATLGLRPAPEFEAWLASGAASELRLPAMLPPTPTPMSEFKEDAVKRGRAPSDGKHGIAAREGAPAATLMESLRRVTSARVGLRRAGTSLATEETLAFQLAHAQARDAVNADLDVDGFVERLRQELRLPNLPDVQVITLRSSARDRAIYLRRPDLGRTLDSDSAARLKTSPCDVAFVIADGLSTLAVERHAIPLLAAVLPAVVQAGWSCSPICVVEQARVAIGDAIGAALASRLSVVLIGERPGLSSSDSLGVYITWHPEPGRTDAERNCISNIRGGGLSYEAAAARLLWYLQAARLRRLTGTALKEQGNPRLSG